MFKGNMAKMLNATDEEVLALNKQNRLLQDSIDTADALGEEFEAVGDIIEDINSQTSFVDKLAEGFKIIPGFGPLLAGPLDALSKGIERRINQFPIILQPLIQREYIITKKYENSIFSKFKKLYGVKK